MNQFRTILKVDISCQPKAACDIQGFGRGIFQVASNPRRAKA